MGLKRRLRHVVAYIKYTPGLPGKGETPFAERGVIDIIGEDAEKQDVIRHMVFHKRTQRRLLPKRRERHNAVTLAEAVVRDQSIDVSTDPTDYDTMDEYITAVQEAQVTYFFTSVLPELVDAGIVEVTGEDGKWVRQAREIPALAEKDVVDSVGDVRAGRRFEFAAHTVRWIDATGQYY